MSEKTHIPGLSEKDERQHEKALEHEAEQVARRSGGADKFGGRAILKQQKPRGGLRRR
jgi:hypothetical protein